MSNKIEFKLSPRQLNILYAVVKEYCDTGKLVGSTQLKERYGFDFSPATIRNELAVLKSQDYIIQPFTSSGSKPTEKGFRLFVEELMKGLQMTSREQQKLKKRLIQMEEQQSQMSLVISKFLANQTGGIGFTLGNDNQSVSGLSSLLSNDNNETESVATVLQFLDNLPSYRTKLLQSGGDQNKFRNELQLANNDQVNRLTTVIGSENPILPLSSDYSLIATEVTLENGEKSVVGIIASTRIVVKQENLTLVRYLSKLLSNNK